MQGLLKAEGLVATLTKTIGIAAMYRRANNSKPVPDQGSQFSSMDGKGA